MKIFLAVLTYDGKVDAVCAESILKNTHILRDSGHTVMPYFHIGDCYLDRARNTCVDMFLKETDCDRIIFIDSDLGFDDDAILKLIKHHKDIVGGAYPYRPNKKVTGYPVVLKFVDRDEHRNCKDEGTGMAMALSIPTGFMQIKRDSFRRMEMYCKLAPDHKGVIHYFKTGVQFEDDNTWYGEDTAFCKQWIDIGGEIFIEPDITFNHGGAEGNYLDHLLHGFERIQNLDAVSEGIRGWMSSDELKILSELASKSKSVVEIGSWKGRSTKALLDACKGIVTAVDHFKGTGNDTSSVVAETTDIYKEFIKNVGHCENLRVVVGNSLDIARRMNGEVFDMVFIDADHSYEGCKADIEAWLPKAKKFIAGHDYSTQFSGVVRAVNEKFPNIKRIDSIWYHQIEN